MNIVKIDELDDAMSLNVLLVLFALLVGEGFPVVFQVAHVVFFFILFNGSHEPFMNIPLPLKFKFWLNQKYLILK